MAFIHKSPGNADHISSLGIFQALMANMKSISNKTRMAIGTDIIMEALFINGP